MSWMDNAEKTNSDIWADQRLDGASIGHNVKDGKRCACEHEVAKQPDVLDQDNHCQRDQKQE